MHFHADSERGWRRGVDAAPCPRHASADLTSLDSPSDPSAMLLALSPDVLTALPPADRAVAELKAIVGERTNKAVFLDIVRAVEMAAADGRPWSHAKLNESLGRLTRAGVLSSDGAVVP